MSGQEPRQLIFDRHLLRRRRDRAAAEFERYDFLINEMTDRLIERLGDVRRSFERTLVLGCHTGQVAEKLPGHQVGDIVQTDLSPAMAGRVGGPRLVADEEALPFGFDQFDLVIATGNLHLVNDLPGTLIQIRYTLKPDGLLLAALPGGRTLPELRHCLAEAEPTQYGRIIPFIDVADAGALMQRTGYTLPVVDIDTLTVSYGDPMRLLRDLRGMAESNMLNQRSPLRRDVLMRACHLYQQAYADERGRIPATFQILMLAGWCPGPGQPKPLRRGSGKTNLADALGH